MNKIYKVIWNEARNAYVVVSEIAKNHAVKAALPKSCSTKKLLYQKAVDNADCNGCDDLCKHGSGDGCAKC